jgi:hypothetical protein
MVQLDITLAMVRASATRARRRRAGGRGVGVAVIAILQWVGGLMTAANAVRVRWFNPAAADP